LIDADCPYGALMIWTYDKNTQVLGGKINGAGSVLECQRACFRTPNCNGLDWDATLRRGIQCYLLRPLFKSKNPRQGVTHYNLERFCLSPDGTLVVFSLRGHAILCEVHANQSAIKK